MKTVTARVWTITMMDGDGRFGAVGYFLGRTVTLARRNGAIAVSNRDIQVQT
jgi:hypothetical protein